MTRGTRILLVDDDPAIRTLLGLAFEDAGWQIVSVDSAEAALLRLRNAAFDILMVDKALPGIDGVEFIRTVRKADPDVAVMMITGEATLDSATELLELGIDGYLEKPFSDVYAVVERVTEVVSWREEHRKLVATSGDRHFRKAIEALSREPDAWRDHTHVVIACADSADREWIARELEDCAKSIECVDSSSDAIEKVKRGETGLLIVDAELRDPALLDLLRALQEHAPDTACLVTYGEFPLSKVIDAINLGVAGLLEKPLQGDALREKVKRIAQSRARRAAAAADRSP